MENLRRQRFFRETIINHGVQATLYCVQGIKSLIQGKLLSQFFKVFASMSAMIDGFDVRSNSEQPVKLRTSP